MSNHQSDEDKLLESLGYKQEFHRGWSGFSNFAISFSIISILSGCFTMFFQAWNNGGPVAISIGWPIISALILIIALCMGELVSAMPTAGGIFYWAFALGKPIHGWMTGWLNLVGLVAVIAGVDYGFSQFFIGLMNSLQGNWWNVGDLHQVFIVFMITVLVHILMNIYGAKVIHSLQNINVYWHVLGVAAILAILIFLPKHHQSLHWVFTTHYNNSGFSPHMFWWYVLPLGFLMTQYTITGFDASAHVSEETSGASTSAAKGMWQSVAYSAVFGWVMLLSFLFAATDPDAVTKGGGAVTTIFSTALSTGWYQILMLLTIGGQFFCGMSCVTAASRMMFAFAREGAVPGHKYWTKLDKNRNPSHAAFGAGFFCIVLALPAWWNYTAFAAITSVTVLGLFLAFMIPIYLRIKQGDHFKVGKWNIGKHYKWMGPLAVFEIVFMSVFFCMPSVPAGVPWNDSFSWRSVNYAPLALLAVVVPAMIWWFAGAKKWFKSHEHSARLLD